MDAVHFFFQGIFNTYIQFACFYIYIFMYIFTLTGSTVYKSISHLFFGSMRSPAWLCGLSWFTLCWTLIAYSGETWSVLTFKAYRFTTVGLGSQTLPRGPLVQPCGGCSHSAPWFPVLTMVLMVQCIGCELESHMEFCGTETQSQRS